MPDTEKTGFVLPDNTKRYSPPPLFNPLPMTLCRTVVQVSMNNLIFLFLVILLIHWADSHTAVGDHYIHKFCPSVLPSVLFATGETVGLAEWIIDDTSLVSFIYLTTFCVGRFSRDKYIQLSNQIIQNST